MELSKLVRKPLPLIVSYKGSTGILRNYQEKLCSFFSQNAVLWKRSGKSNSFPIDVKISLEFVTFSKDILVDFNNTTKKWRSFAFLHFFFIDPVTVDEYKNTWRNEVSEWFATVNSTENTAWIIVFDSSNAREKKTRGALLERIKNDFSKFTQRVIEVYNGSVPCTSSFQILVQNELLASLDIFVSSRENYVANYKERYCDADFDFIEYCSSQMDLSSIYYSLGIIEQSVYIFDEIDALLTLIVCHFHYQTSLPQWLCTKNSLFEESCPLFVKISNYEKALSNMSLIELRYLILANQILLSFQLYLNRVDQESLEDRSLKSEMKYDFAGILSKYSHHCIINIFQNISALMLKYDLRYLNCWIIAFCIEIYQVMTLVDSVLVENASHSACSLAIIKCNAIAEHAKLQDEIVTEKLVSWFEKGVESLDKDALEATAILELRCIIGKAQQFSHFIQKYHESAIVLLKRFNWKRQAKLLGWQLADFLMSSDRAEGALPYLLKFVTGLIREGSSEIISNSALIVVTKQLSTVSDLYFKELIEFYSILAISCETNEERSDYCKKLLELSERCVSSRVRLQSTINTIPLTFHLSDRKAQEVALPGDYLNLRIIIRNMLPLNINNYSVRAYFNLASSIRTSTRQFRTKSPFFESSFNNTDGISRFSCTWKGDLTGSSLRPPNRCGEIANDLEGNGDRGLTFSNLSSLGNIPELKNGDNELILSSQAIDSGVYLLDHIEVDIGSALYASVMWYDIEEIENSYSFRPTFVITRKTANIKIKPLDSCLYAGVCQRIEFEFIAGTELVSKSTASLYLGTSEQDSGIEFWDDSSSIWAKMAEISVTSLAANEVLIVPVYICKLLMNLIKSNRDEQRIAYFHEICIKWLGRSWKFSLEFLPIVNITTTTSLLEERVLFEMQILRSYNDFWLLIPQEANFILTNSVPEYPAKLLNKKLTEIHPRSSYRFVWILPNIKNINQGDYKIMIKYQAKQETEENDDLPKKIYSRDYTFSDFVTVTRQAPSYELCAQILSSNPGAILCRVDSECDLIVSLRSLTNKVETVVISIDADCKIWEIAEKYKFLYVKESGLGQTSFAIIPKMVGFLPYPSISVHCCRERKSITERTSIISDSVDDDDESISDFGAKLSSFVRTNGKQVHVLGAFSHSTDLKSKLFEKSSGRFKDAKSRLTKLFD